MQDKIKKLRLILSLTSIRSPAMIQAFELYYITKMPLRQVVKFAGVTNSNFCKANKKYLEVEKTINEILKIKEVD